MTDALEFIASMGGGPDTRSPLLRQMSGFAADDARATAEDARRAQEAEDKRTAWLHGLHAAGTSPAELSRAQHDVSEQASVVQDLEEQLARAKRALKSRRAVLGNIAERSAAAAGMASRAQQDDLLAPAKATWAVMMELDAERRMTGRTERTLRRMQREYDARELDRQDATRGGICRHEDSR